MPAIHLTKIGKNVVTVQDAFEIIIPASLMAENSISGECSILIQIEPQDAALLDFEGASGAIGRFESDEKGGE
jgi:hypothetical protein